MSYDLFFQPCRYDGTTETRVNPFTKQPQDFPRNQPLSEVEVKAVRRVLERSGAASRDDGRRLIVHLDDGGGAEIFAGDLSNGCMFALRGAGVTTSLGRLLFDVMVAGQWVLTGTGEEALVIAPSMACVTGAPAGLGRVVVASSGTEVAARLAGGFADWRAERERVLGGAR